MLGKADAIRFHLMPVLVNLTQVGFGVQMLARLVRVLNNSSSEIYLLVTALSASLANGFPLLVIHDYCSLGRPPPPGIGNVAQN
jgi:hypothetical protein